MELTFNTQCFTLVTYIEDTRISKYPDYLAFSKVLNNNDEETFDLLDNNTMKFNMSIGDADKQLKIVRTVKFLYSEEWTQIVFIEKGYTNYFLLKTKKVDDIYQLERFIILVHKKVVGVDYI